MKQGEQLAAVAGSVKGRDDYKQTSEGWLAHYSSLFFLCRGLCGLSGRPGQGCGSSCSLSYLPVNLFQPRLCTAKAGQLGPQPHLHPIMSGETLDTPSLLPVLKTGMSVPTS